MLRRKHMPLDIQILNSSQKQKSNSYTHIFRVHRHGETAVDNLRRRVDLMAAKMAAIYRKYMGFVVYNCLYIR